MQHARRDSDAPPEPDLAGLAAKAEATRQQAEGYLARVGAILDAVEAGRPLPDGLTHAGFTGLWHSLRQVGAAQWMTGEQLKERSLEQSLADMVRTAAEGPRLRAEAAARHRHRAPKAARSRRPGRNDTPLFAVPDEDAPAQKPPSWQAPAAFSGLAAGAEVLRHSTVAKALLGLGTAASLAVATPNIVQPLLSPPARSAAQGQVQAFAGLAPADAIPLGSLPSPRSSYVPRHAKGAPDAKGAALAPPPPVAAPSPPVPSAEPSAPSPGVLDVQQVSVTIGLSGTARIALASVGGPLEWHASASAGLTLSSEAGILGDRQSAVITVSVERGIAGAGTVTIWAGGQTVVIPVTVAALPGLGL